MYIIENCQWCLLAKGLMKQYNIECEIIVCESPEVEKQEAKNKNNMDTFPNNNTLKIQ